MNEWERPHWFLEIWANNSEDVDSFWRPFIYITTLSFIHFIFITLLFQPLSVITTFQMSFLCFSFSSDFLQLSTIFVGCFFSLCFRFTLICMCLYTIVAYGFFQPKQICKLNKAVLWHSSVFYFHPYSGPSSDKCARHCWSKNHEI